MCPQGIFSWGQSALACLGYEVDVSDGASSDGGPSSSTIWPGTASRVTPSIVVVGATPAAPNRAARTPRSSRTSASSTRSPRPSVHHGRDRGSRHGVLRLTVDPTPHEVSINRCNVRRAMRKKIPFVCS